MNKERIMLANRLFRSQQLGHLETIINLVHEDSFEKMLEHHHSFLASVSQAPESFRRITLSPRTQQYLAAEASAILKIFELCYDADKEAMLEKVRTFPDLYEILPPLVKLDDKQ